MRRGTVFYRISILPKMVEIIGLYFRIFWKYFYFINWKNGIEPQ